MTRGRQWPWWFLQGTVFLATVSFIYNLQPPQDFGHAPAVVGLFMAFLATILANGLLAIGRLCERLLRCAVDALAIPAPRRGHQPKRRYRRLPRAYREREAAPRLPLAAPRMSSRGS